ncbi:MAG: glycosyltransferase family 2 protein [Zetaproteobacteria bacterium]|nr:glycosyltransferase family 2 protein [Zetaproteobacteria bacterium]
MTSDTQLDLSVIMIVHNEESNLEDCLNALPQGCELIIVDSGSKDNTLQIATDFGAKVLERKFTNYGDQKNFALQHATRKWVLSLDADERCSSTLQQWLETYCLKNRQKNQPHSNTLYQVQRHLIFMGKRMRFGGCSDKPLRFFPNHPQIKFQGEVHESIPRTSMNIATLPGYIAHYSYKDWSEYLHKFNLYTSLSANKRSTYNPKVAPLSIIVHALRPWIEFVKRYFLKLGFLDGYAGYSYALVSSMYAFMKYAKLRELYEKAKKPA